MIWCWKILVILTSFYRAMLCIRGISHGPVSVSVCPSVTSRCSTKRAKRRIIQSTPHDSAGNLVFWRQWSPRNSTGVIPTGAPNAVGVGQNRRLSTNNGLYSTMWRLSLVVSECSLSGSGQGHVSNFYIVDLRNFTTASRRYTGDFHNSVRSRFVYDTYKTMEATRSRHGWVHMFITHRPTLTLQLHNFDLFRTCRRRSLCTVSWQLARFQLTRRIARSLEDSWASCYRVMPRQHDRFRPICVR